MRPINYKFIVNTSVPSRFKVAKKFLTVRGLTFQKNNRVCIKSLSNRTNNLRLLPRGKIVPVIFHIIFTKRHARLPLIQLSSRSLSNNRFIRPSLCYCLFQVRYQIIFFAYFVFKCVHFPIIDLYDLLYYLLSVSGQISIIFSLISFLECVHFPIIDLYDLLYYLLSVSGQISNYLSLISFLECVHFQ